MTNTPETPNQEAPPAPTNLTYEELLGKLTEAARAKDAQTIKSLLATNCSTPDQNADYIRQGNESYKDIAPQTHNKNTVGMDALHKALRNKDVECVKALLDGSNAITYEATPLKTFGGIFSGAVTTPEISLKCLDLLLTSDKVPSLDEQGSKIILETALTSLKGGITALLESNKIDKQAKINFVAEHKEHLPKENDTTQHSVQTTPQGAQKNSKTETQR